jgi:hypothetical protein
MNDRVRVSGAQKLTFDDVKGLVKELVDGRRGKFS